MVVLGSGGHTAEMLGLLELLTHKEFDRLVFVIAESDTTSEPKLRQIQRFAHPDIRRLPRSREVHQSYLSSIPTTIKALLFSFRLVLEVDARLLLCNGPGTCIPLLVASWLLRTIRILDTRLVFVESFARVKTVSLSGKIAYHLVDKFVVQWEQLCVRYPRAIYLGLLC